MSKGPGRVMREALEVVRASSLAVDSFAIAALVYGVKPGADGIRRLSAAQVSSVRRAMAKLVRAGKVADIGRSACAPTSRRSYATLERAAEIDRQFGHRFAPTDPIRPS